MPGAIGREEAGLKGTAIAKGDGAAASSKGPTRVPRSSLLPKRKSGLVFFAGTSFAIYLEVHRWTWWI